MLFSKKESEKQQSQVNNNEENEEQVKLEKGDSLAILIAALIVFIPFVVVFAGVVLLIYWAFIGRF